MRDLPFLVAGGGIAGLAAAIGLARTGRTVRLFEQAAAFEEVGAGLQVTPNAVRALQWLGAWEAVEPSCVIPTEIHVRDGRSGSILQRIRLGKPFERRFGAPYRVCHRSDLLSGLARTARQSALIGLNLESRVTGFSQSAGHVTAHLSTGKDSEGIALIAADGIRSELRSLIAGASAPVFRGHAIFRALIPFEKVPNTTEADCVTLWLHPGGHVVHYPVSNWKHFNIVAAADAGAAETGWYGTVEPAAVKQHFAGAEDSLLDLLAAPPHWIKWQGADLGELPRWASGRAVLTGDAAHATLPYLAQGAAMGLEDAVALSSRVVSGEGVASAFAAFEALRKPRTSRIQTESRHLGRVYHARGAMALARNAALRLMGAEAAMRRNAWIYEWRP